jgi:hypothetical protein
MRIRTRLLGSAAVVALAGLLVAAAANPPAAETLYQKGVKAYRQHSYKPATEAFGEYLKRFPEAGRAREVRFLLAESYRKARRIGRQYVWPQAEKAYKALTEGETKDLWRARAKVGLAELYFRYNSYQHRDEAQTLVDEAIETYEGRVDKTSSRELRRELAGAYITRIQAGLRVYGYDANWREHLKNIQQGQPGQAERPAPAPPANAPVLQQRLMAQAQMPARQPVHIPDKVDEQTKKRFAFYAMVETLIAKVDALEPGRDLQAAARWAVGQRGGENYLEEIVATFDGTEVHDDALYHLARQREGQQKYIEALQLYGKLAEQYAPNRSKYVKQARQRIENIRKPTINVNCPYVSLPGTKPMVHYNWRNQTKATFRLYRTEPFGQPRHQSLRDMARAGRGAEIKSWTRELKNEGKHLHHNDQEHLDIAEEGVYLLTAKAGPGSSDTLVVVTSLAAVTKTSREQSQVFVAHALTGEPVAGADVQVSWRVREGRRYVWHEAKGETNDAGMFQHDLPGKQRHYRMHLLARTDGGEHKSYAYAQTYRSWWQRRRPDLSFYGYTDRPAYRPEESVHFKFIVRNYDGSAYQNVAGQQFRVRVNDARGSKVYEKVLATNETGTLHGTLGLSKEPKLGQWTIHVRRPNNQGNRGYARFRVEEYKLPEFKVAISPSKPTYRLGDTVELSVNASYYFGGPVPEADCEIIVRQNRYWHFYRPPHDYPWYYTDIYHRRWRRWGWYPHRGRGSIVKRATVKTDEHGVARLSFETPKPPDDKNQRHDYQYSIEARVTDKSRREINSRANVKVTAEPFYVYVRPKQHVYLPGDRIEVEVVARNANDEPVETEGMFRVYRAVYNSEKEDYDLTELQSDRLATDAEGKAQATITPDQPGYLKLEMTALTEKEEKVIGTGWAWVASKDEKYLGYRLSGVEVVPDKLTYKKGETAQVLLVSHFPNAHVWLGVEGDRIYDSQLVFVGNRSKLLTIPIRDEHSPNVFITANLVRDAMLWRHQKEIVVPPEDRFIDVKIASEKKSYLPGEEAQFTLTATDHQGRPVDCELSLGLVDSSVYYIQPEYAGDIRQHFYGKKRRLAIRTDSSFSRMRYRREARGEERERAAEEPQARKQVLREQAAANGVRSRRAAAPAAPGAPMAMAAKAKGGAPRAMDRAEKADSGAQPEMAEAVVREDFRATAFWQPAIRTGSDGKAVVTVPFPDSLTDWRATARAVTPDTAVGNVTHSTKTKKNIIVRLQAPRFFQEKDRLVISAVVHNYLEKDKKVRVSLRQSGLRMADEPVTDVTVPAGGETRVDWRVQVVAPGEAKLTAMAQTDVESDAMTKTYEVLPHGVEKYLAQSGTVGEPVVAPKGQPGESQEARAEVTATLNLPAERNRLSTVLNVDLSPSIASTMLDSLEYLAKYPYGCTEQTMSRFLPSVITAKTLRDLGVRNEKLEAKLPDMVAKGLDRLYSFQRPDGGWGWWSGGDGNPWMTAYVVYGLTLAGDAGYSVDKGRVQRGIQFLKSNLVRLEDRSDTLAYCLYVLAHHDITDRKLLDRTWAKRDELNACSRALMAAAYHKLGDRERARISLRNLEDRVWEDKDTGTAHWGKTSGYYRWSYDAVEATSYALKAYLAIEPEHRLVKAAMKWLVANRRGSRWKSTRDTAMAVYSLADYVQATNELAPDYKVTVYVNDEPVRTLTVTKDNALDLDGRVTLGDSDLKSGPNTIRIVKEGSGNLYYSTGMFFYTKEEKIQGAGHELFVDRSYTKVALDEENQEVRTPLEYGDPVRSGDRIEVTLKIEAKNNYEYLVFEDPKPSGCEAVAIRSGYQYFQPPKEMAEKRREGDLAYHGGTRAYMEVRDEQTAFFCRSLKQGYHFITYQLRAEIPGTFNALPTSGYAMYIPDIRGLSDEMRLRIGERQEAAAAARAAQPVLVQSR